MRIDLHTHTVASDGLLDAAQLIRLAGGGGGVSRRAGGIPVLAHPGWLGDDGMVDGLLAAGLEGIEAYYPDHTPAMVERYLEVARRFNLLVTGGTDFHGGDLATRGPRGGQDGAPPGGAGGEPVRAARGGGSPACPGRWAPAGTRAARTRVRGGVGGST